MKEITFLKQNENKWLDLEKDINITQTQNPKQLAEQFLELTDDLSYSRTHYPNSKTTEYLNGLTAKVHQEIYKNKREKSARLFNFWKFELPYMFYHQQKKLLIALLIFLIGGAIGALCQRFDEQTIRMMVPDSYVNERIHEIENDQAMSWYGDENPILMFMKIPLNNIKVSFVFFILGFLFSIGTAIALFYNSALVGALGMMFKQYGYFKVFFMIIMIHGSFELTSMIVEAVAGFVLGASITNPGTLPRGQSILLGAKNGLKIAIGCVPIIIIAGVLECFVTRFYHMPTWANWLIILLSISCMVFYFVVYPIILNKKYNFNAKSFKDLKI